MAGETTITVIGNLVDEVELRFTPAGAAVAKFRVASTPRRLNRESNTWEDDKDGALFLSCSVWRQAAENVAESLAKGMRVIVQGRLRQRSFEDREGQKRTVFELDVDEVGPSLRSATAAVTKTSGSGGGQGQRGGQQGRGGSSGGQRGGGSGGWGQQQGGSGPAGDPWASGGQGSASAGGSGGGSWGGGYSDEPPF
ncbi:single-stranded DNA-binding protein [Streptomyces sp. NEAU-H3]|uniref:single-stranded DNA-binding protein n=1 Tax=Streptomyces sp. NEAU-H3 TaxID=2720636 RepID=UPI001438E497|nr:single-stranded DNA-binding protein [Streptomyces sp. NEAU-H3]NJA56697.1 single-stranded DNA-binding protein [Streptomyces sp. NEAU-H3]